jgi:hypothetical protein
VHASFRLCARARANAVSSGLLLLSKTDRDEDANWGSRCRRRSSAHRLTGESVGDDSSFVGVQVAETGARERRAELARYLGSRLSARPLVGIRNALQC